MKRDARHVQGFMHGFRKAISLVHSYADEMNDPSAKAALRACAHSMGVEKDRLQAAAALEEYNSKGGISLDDLKKELTP